MFGTHLPLQAAILGLGLLTAAQVQAQGTASGTGDEKAVRGSTAGPVNPTLDAPLPPPNTGTGNLIQMQKLLNARIQGRDGAFGQVADIVFDRNGRVQYILASHNGQVFSLPFMPTALSGANGTLTYDVPVGTLAQLAIDPRNLPTMNNQAFVQRMQEVFGPTFGTRALSAYPPGAPGAADMRTGVSGSGAPVTRGAGLPGGRRPTGGSAVIGRDPGTGVGGTGIGGPGTSGSGTGRSGTGEGTAGSIPGTGSGTSAAGKLQGAAVGGAPGSTGGTAGSAGGAPDRSKPPGAGTRGGSGTSAAGKSSGAANGGAPGSTGGTSRSGGGSTDSRGGNTTGGTTGTGTTGSSGSGS